MLAAIGWHGILAWRMRRQFLVNADASSVEEAVHRLVAVPSWSGDAELAIGTRMRHPRLGAVAAAFEQGRLVKTFAFRGSMNYFVPEDVGTYLAIRAVGRQWELKSWRQFYSLEPEDWPLLRAVVRDALSSGPLSQRELATVVVRDARFSHLAAAFTDRSCTFLKPFAWQGDLCLGPARDGVLMLQSPLVASGWSGIPDVEDAGPRAVRAYLSSYGPASADHLQYWLGEGLSAGRKRIAGWIERMLENEIVTLDVDGDELLCHAGDVDELASEPEPGAMHLLPGLDPWVLGAGTADTHIVPPDRRGEISRGANPVTLDGRVVGTWKIADDLLTVATFGGALPRDLLEAARGRLSEVLGRNIDVDDR
ncbi:DNA glycosylase AlkZ-like family protein [Agromyces sp. Marseille-Q5079]|uniref:DNA glycosylase AlkZ-like family protein n=1 Tax=Agromyces sp. Marseille-Q5079 TaxID=3439059 RepID=UPI003D9CBAAD